MDTRAISAHLKDLKGLRGYVQKIALFSRNARLYLLHVIGMDLIHGTWEVLFNLYLLAIGFGIDFIGLRIAIMGVAGAVASVPMGWLSDRLGRKTGFILGDGGGALMSLIQILSVNPIVLLGAPAISALFGALHHVTEPAFMAENSEQRERVHLFSVSDGLRTLSAMAGSLVAGFLPLWAATQFGWDKVTAYRVATYLGIAWWFLSLVPAVMLRPYVSGEVAQTKQSPPATTIRARAWRALFANIKNPVIIGKLLIVNAFISLGGAFVIQLFNVFFKEGVHAHEHEIGTTFAAGSLFLALGAFLAPFVSERLGKVASVFVTRLASVPFILLIGLAPQLATPETVISLAGLAYVLRTTLFNLANPVFDAFSMELLHPSERATAVGLESTVGRILTAIGGFLGALLMNAGDYRTPFFVMTAMYLISTFFFWGFFRKWEAQTNVGGS
jgi:MFS family permease